MINKLMRLCDPAFDFKGKDRRTAIWKIFLIQFMIRMFWQGWVIYFFHHWVLFEERNYFSGIFSMTLQAKGQGFNPLQEKKCCKRRNRCTHITEQNSTDIGNKGCIFGCIYKGDSMVAWIRFCNRRVFVPCTPVKIAGIYNDSSKGCAMSSQEFCGRVYHNICTMLNRTDEIWCSKGIIHHQGQPCL